jgi:acetyl esterase/lipase
VTRPEPMDPDLRPGIDLIPTLEVDEGLLSRARALGEEFQVPAESYARPDVVVETRHVPGPAGAPDVRVIFYRSTSATGQSPALVYIHGGGFVFGTVEADGPIATQLAADLNCVVVTVDYRLAPETRAPGSAEDCYAVLKWILDNAPTERVDPARVALWGPSAGGGLAAAVGLMARDRGGPPICFQMLIYPMLDDRTAARTDVPPHLGRYVWTNELNAFGWQALLGVPPGSPEVPAYSVPARSVDLAGLPPTYIGTAGLDLFVEENLEFARRLIVAGVPTEVHVTPGAYHGFELNVGAPAVIKAYQSRVAALRRAFGT